MRASTRINDPGYTPDARHFHVYLDGKPLRNCHTADEETGEAFVYMLDPESRRQAILTGAIPKMRLTGEVKIIDTRNFAASGGGRRGQREMARRRRQTEKGMLRV